MSVLDGITANAIDMNLGKLLEMVVPIEACLMQSMTSQGVRYDFATKQQKGAS